MLIYLFTHVLFAASIFWTSTGSVRFGSSFDVFEVLLFCISYLFLFLACFSLVKGIELVEIVHTTKVAGDEKKDKTIKATKWRTTTSQPAMFIPHP